MPVYYGAINRFMLHGDHGNDVYATGGDLELTQEPKSMYDDVKIVPLNKLDRYATDQSIMRAIAEEETKLVKLIAKNFGLKFFICHSHLLLFNRIMGPY